MRQEGRRLVVTDVREILPDVRVSVGNGNRCEHCNTVIRPFVELTPVAVNVGGGNVEIKGVPLHFVRYSDMRSMAWSGNGHRVFPAVYHQRQVALNFSVIPSAEHLPRDFHGSVGNRPTPRPNFRIREVPQSSSSITNNLVRCRGVGHQPTPLDRF